MEFWKDVQVNVHPIQVKCHTAIVYNILEYAMDTNRLNNITYGFAY